MVRLGRRDLLRHGAAAAVAGAMPFVVTRRARALGFGELVADPNGVLDLPPGFSYSIVESAGETMTDGYLVPSRPDGMAAFPGPDGTVILMRNHELDADSGSGAYGLLPVPAEAYDATRYGGVTRLVLDGATFSRVSSNLVLTGTSRNCAGGPSPWGWLSCEESTLPGHGYVFLCATDATSVRPPERILGYGRLYHEAVAIEPGTNAAYLTEDRGDGCLYRFLPDDPAAPFVGKLQALGVEGRPQLSTASGLARGESLPVVWFDVGDPDSVTDTLRYRAVDAGAATFYRGEGIAESGGVIYVAATFGGNTGYGQIFALRPTRDGGTLTVLGDSPGPDVLNGPDNVTVAPWGDVVVAEDGTDAYRYLRGLTAGGVVYDIARTSRGELAGVCFSPDGRALFANIQDAGLTLVLTGPFDDYDASGGGGEQPGGGGQGDGGAAGTFAVAGTAGGAGSAGSADAGGAYGGRGGASGAAGGLRGGASGTGAPPSGGAGGRSSATGPGGTGGSARVVRPGLRRDFRLDSPSDPGCACGVVGRRPRRR